MKKIFFRLFIFLSLFSSIQAELAPKENKKLALLTNASSHPSCKKYTVPLSHLSPELQKQVRAVVTNYDIYLLERLSKEEK